MGRNPVEINPIRGQRLKQLLSKQNMMQRELAEALGCTKEHISYIVRGKRNLTQEIAEKIILLFPHIPFNWLMGYDDFESDLSKEVYAFGQWGKEEETRRKAVKALAFLSGYEIEDTYDFMQAMEKRPVEEIIKFNSRGYPIRQNGAIVSYIPTEKFNLLALDIQELAELRIKSYLREVEESG